MFTYFAHRVMVMVPTLLVISVITFIIIQLPPGDYLSNQMAEMLASGDRAAMEKLAFLRQEFGLDKPMLEQYAVWLGIWPGNNGFSGILQGNLGWSFEYNLPVSEVVGDRLFLSLVLNFTTMLFVYAVSFPIGVYTAVRQYSFGDHAMTFIGYIGLATPNFLLALILLFLAKKHFGVSIGGLMDEQFIDADMSWAKFLSICEHMVVPVIVIGTSGTAGMIRRLRANLLDELQKQYVTTARAKGLLEKVIINRHALKNAMLPVVTIVAIEFAFLMGGLVVTEQVFNLNGLGKLFVESVQNHDFSMTQALVMLVAFIFVVTNLTVDIFYAWLDPRIRYS